MIRNYELKVKVPISITWSQELVEDDDNFYMRLTPHLNRGGKKGSPSLTRTQSDTGISRIVLTTAYNQLMKKIKADKELKDKIKKAVRGQKIYESKPVIIQGKKPVTEQFSKEELESGESLFKESVNKEIEREAEQATKVAAERKAKTDPFAKQSLKGNKVKLEDI